MKKKFDRIEFKIERKSRGTYLFYDAEIHINNRNLLDLITEAELPYAIAEGNPDLAGNYKMRSLGWVLAELHPWNQKLFPGPSVIMCCAHCGEAMCWPLCVRVKDKGKYILWSSFHNWHRKNWKHKKLGPFHFERSDYYRKIRTVTRLLEKLNN